MNKNNVFAETCCICIFQDRSYADVMWNGGLLEGHMLFKILQHARVLFAYHNILDTMPRASMHMRQQAMETRNWLNIFCVLARYQQARGSHGCGGEHPSYHHRQCAAVIPLCLIVDLVSLFLSALT
jgi:hypothetical protein